MQELGFTYTTYFEQRQQQHHCNIITVQCNASIELIGYQDLIAHNSGLNSFGSSNLAMLNTAAVSLFALLMASGNLTAVHCDLIDKKSLAALPEPEVPVKYPLDCSSAACYTVVVVDHWLQVKLMALL